MDWKKKMVKRMLKIKVLKSILSIFFPKWSIRFLSFLKYLKQNKTQKNDLILFKKSEL